MKMEKWGKPKLWQWVLWGLCLGFCLLSSVGFFVAGNGICGLICMGTGLLVTLPLAVEWLGWGANPWFYVFLLFYAMGPMLGKAYKLYYLTNWWDKLLHTSAGLVFAVVGAELAQLLNGKGETSLFLRVIFGICFSIALSALWELVEFGVDTYFGGDMQNDSIVYNIRSYLLSEIPGEMVSLPDIRQVTVNGVELPVAGYLDIGLIDTMCDVLVETCGAVVYGVWALVDRGRHPLLWKVN